MHTAIGIPVAINDSSPPINKLNMNDSFLPEFDAQRSAHPAI
jgi:hypothetical protein